MAINPFTSKSQVLTAGSLQHLFNENGFRGITLGADIKTIKDKLEYLDGKFNMDTDSCINYAYKNEDVLELDSDHKLDLIAVRTYKNKIVNIFVFFNTKDAYVVLRNFIQDYGQYTNKPTGYTGRYDWITGVIDLAFYCNPDIDKGVATFTSDTLLKTIETAKLKHVEISPNGVAVTRSYTMP